MHTTLSPLVLLVILSLAACSQKAPPSSASTDSPQATFEALAQYEREQNFQKYTSCFTPRGRAWLISELANVLILSTIQPINPQPNSPSETILKKYGLADIVQQVRRWQLENDSEEYVYQKIDEKFGPQLPNLLRDFHNANPEQLFFPAKYQIVESHLNGDSALITITDPTTTVAGENLKTTIRFLKQNNHWLCDGEPPETPASQPASTGIQK